MNKEDQLLDYPTKKDKLNFKKYTSPLVKRILKIGLNASTTIGIYGPWGSGKTSFLMMMEEHFKKSNINTIWFNAWKYEKEENLFAALLQTILFQMTLNGNFIQRFFIRIKLWRNEITISKGLIEVLRKIVPILCRFLLAITFIYVFFDIGSDDFLSFIPLISGSDFFNSIKKSSITKPVFAFLAFLVISPIQIIKLFHNTKLNIDYSKFHNKKKYKDHIAFLDVFNEELQKIVNITRNKKPLIIFIDDLDRCMPSKSIQVLEAIKLFIDIEGCIFVMAVDQQLIENAISLKYKDLISINKVRTFNDLQENIAENYFEKIIQLPISIPALSNETCNNYILDLCQDPEIVEIADLFIKGLPNNPRKIKRMINIFLFIKELAQEDINSGNIHIALLVKLIIIQYRFKDLYDVLFNEILMMETIEKICTHIITEKEKETVIYERAQTFLSKNPNLRDIIEYKTNEEDSFINVNINNYLYMLTSVNIKESISKHHNDGDESNDDIIRNYLYENQKLLENIRIFDSNNKVNIADIFVQMRFKSFSKSNSEELFISDLFNRSSKSFIIGKAGSGKTTLLKYLCFVLSKNYKKFSSSDDDWNSKDLIPIYLSSRIFNNVANSNYSIDHIISTINSTYFNNEMSIKESFLEHEIVEGRCVIMFDGIDEILPSSNRNQIIHAINELSIRYPNNYFIVTSRPTIDINQLNINFQFFEILPLQHSEIIELTNKRYKDNKKSDFINKSLNSFSILEADFFNTPLTLNMFLSLFDNNNEIPESTSKVVSKYLETILQSHDAYKGINSSPYSINLDRSLSILRELSFYLTSNGKDSFSSIEFKKLLADDDSYRNKTSNSLNFFIDRANLFINDKNNKYKFIHKSIQEYLTAEEIVYSDKYSIVFDNIENPSFQNILLFLLEISPEPRNLLNKIKVYNTSKYRHLISQIEAGRIIINGPDKKDILENNVDETIQQTFEH